MSDKIWFQQEMSLFWINCDCSPTYLDYTVIKRMTWRDAAHASVFLEGILPAARHLLEIGYVADDEIAILWNDCGKPDYYDAHKEVMRLVHCNVCFHRIRNLSPISRDNQEVVRVEVKLDCQLNVVHVE